MQALRGLLAEDDMLDRIVTASGPVQDRGDCDDAVERAGWEASRRDPGLGVSAWWVNHADPQMSALLAVDGCFAAFSDENLPSEPLPYARPPIGLFATDRIAEI